MAEGRGMMNKRGKEIPDLPVSTSLHTERRLLHTHTHNQSASTLAAFHLMNHEAFHILT